MRELSTDELKQIQLEMLLELDKYCHKHNLTYFMCGGTLLGAVRHKGFIPWDDDIDVLMPRKDYEILLHEYNRTSEKYRMKSVELGMDKPIAMMMVCEDIFLKSLSGEDYDAIDKLYIDIFPVDNLSNNRFVRHMFCYIKEFILYCYGGATWSYVPSARYNDRDGGFLNWKSKVRTLLKYMFISVFKVTSSNFWGRMANNISRLWENKNTDWQGCMINQAHYNNGLSELLPKEVFSSTVKLEFEGYQLNAMVGYKEYLTSLYGDYMKMPPKEKQVSHHDFVAYCKEKNKI